MAALTNDQILDAIASMTILELSDLVKAIEEKFGVTAAAPVVMAGGAAGGAAAAEEKTEFNVSLEAADPADHVPKGLGKLAGVVVAELTGDIQDRPIALTQQ